MGFKEEMQKQRERTHAEEVAKKDIEARFTDKKERKIAWSAWKDERKRQEDQVKDQRQTEFEAKTLAAEFDQTPIGKARIAHKSGRKYFQITMDIEEVGRNLLNIMAHEMKTRTKDLGNDVSSVLTLIDDEGWELVSSGFVFRQTRQDSRDKLIVSGQQVAISGQTVGVYVFRRK